jgi:inner membrane protein
MDLAGTGQLSVAGERFEPCGAEFDVAFSAVCRAILPRTRDVGGDGFSAARDVSSLATGTEVQMESKPVDLMNVSLLTPIDAYKLSDRATKYGIFCRADLWRVFPIRDDEALAYSQSRTA